MYPGLEWRSAQRSGSVPTPASAAQPGDSPSVLLAVPLFLFVFLHQWGQGRSSRSNWYTTCTSHAPGQFKPFLQIVPQLPLLTHSSTASIPASVMVLCCDFLFLSSIRGGRDRSSGGNWDCYMACTRTIPTALDPLAIGPCL